MKDFGTVVVRGDVVQTGMRDWFGMIPGGRDTRQIRTGGSDHVVWLDIGIDGLIVLGCVASID